MTEQKTKIIAFVGLVGAGKTEAVKYLSNKGFPKVHFGRIILDEMDTSNIAHTAENERQFREKIRREKGQDFIVQQIIPQIQALINSGQHRIVADGIYSWTEYKAMKKAFPGELTTVAIVAAKRIRHRRCLNSSAHTLSQEEVDNRDWSEIENLEKGGPIAMADYYINNNDSIESFYCKINNVLSEINW